MARWYRRLFLGAVAPQLPGPISGKQHPAHRLIPLLRKDLALDIREIRAEAHHFSGFLGAEALSGAKVGNSLQQIGLSLGIVAHDEIHTGFKIQT